MTKTEMDTKGIYWLRDHAASQVGGRKRQANAACRAMGASCECMRCYAASRVSAHNAELDAQLVAWAGAL